MYRALNDFCNVHKINQQDIAGFLGRSLTYVNSRMTGKQYFTIEDIYIICEKTSIPYEQIPYYFPKDGRDDFSKEYQKRIEKLKGINPLSFADVLLNVGKAMKKIEKSDLGDNVISLFEVKNG